MAQFAASLAHEMVHAYHRMTRSTPDPTLPRHARANAFIEEEIATREKEKTIPKEILAPGKRKPLETPDKKAKSAGLREQSTKQIATKVLSRAQVERDFVSGTNVTYLETFVIEDLIEQSLRAKTSTTRRSRKART